MKRDRIKTLLLAEALICALLALALWLFEGDAFSVTGFPGSAVGQGLSALAASGRFGFALAFTLYAAVILLPLYALVHIGARRELKPEDALLVLIAFAVACALFPHAHTYGRFRDDRGITYKYKPTNHQNPSHRFGDNVPNIVGKYHG